MKKLVFRKPSYQYYYIDSSLLENAFGHLYSFIV